MITSFTLWAGWDTGSDYLLWTAKAIRDDVSRPIYCCRCFDDIDCDGITTDWFFAILAEMAADIGRYKETP